MLQSRSTAVTGTSVEAAWNSPVASHKLDEKARNACFVLQAYTCTQRAIDLRDIEKQLYAPAAWRKSGALWVNVYYSFKLCK